ncbi:PIN domain-containing protein [Pseudobacteriovorax antillogorgiicola]|uniref:PIN domain-containing protein n=1 Tax=Pseudobacteriovorax antillogorgiicola TaxID=1513793 RepID=A0A1Y6CHM4_9BACT|nr:PIN domain-containing protein [Pseudobacteriovorax antillogorgiicola]TCS46979.1 hypothetical protein EDD56_12274 [Pseudobacteriovorax antillogorgiicola]SMF64714.1 hypothetical protein SAMN06296036_12274 [Pseudobacteriovorax antillogorgiicola]
MYILDSNIILEAIKPEPNQGVMRWLSTEIGFGVTAITIEEISFAIHEMSDGKEKDAHLVWFKQLLLFNPDIAIIPYDGASASLFGEMYGKLRTKGLKPRKVDLQIAAIAKVNRSVVATSNTEEFLHYGVSLVNPFEINIA